MSSFRQKPPRTVKGAKTRVMRQSYEATTTSYRLGYTGLTATGPNSENVNAITALKHRSRHAIRNNPVAGVTADSYVANLVGTGAVARWPDPQQQDLWERWVRECDADERMAFAAQQAAVGRMSFVDGEALARFRYRRDESPLSVPLQLQLIESDYLDPGYTVIDSDKRIVAAIQLARTGARTHYHLFRNHPSDHVVLRADSSRIAIPAKDIVHVYQVRRPGQLRGTPALSSVLLLLSELDQMTDAAVVRAKLAELFGVFVTTNPGANSPLGQQLTTTDPDGDKYSDPARPVLTGVTSGAVHYLEPGEEVTFSTPPDMSNLDTILKYALRLIARTASLTYEQVSGDLTSVNFSSIRAGLVEARRRLEQLQLDLIIHQFCRPVARRWAYIAAASGRWAAPADYWQNPEDYMPTWMMPKFRHVQPLEDIKADLLEVRAGFSSRAEKQMERGHWPEDLDAQLAAEQDGDLVLDSNPAKTAANGGAQPVPGADEPDDGADPATDPDQPLETDEQDPENTQN